MKKIAELAIIGKIKITTIKTNKNKTLIDDHLAKPKERTKKKNLIIYIWTLLGVKPFLSLQLKYPNTKF